MISTHTLRKEGDFLDVPTLDNIVLFQPTPSARRVTILLADYIHHHGIFQPTPSARRVTTKEIIEYADLVISTHTLRKEGDSTAYMICMLTCRFQPTPSARRVTGALSDFTTANLDFNPHPPQGG